ncbi:MAG: tetratricopeptide repeat protein [Nitrospiraceae bacterium]|nr:tetratricopeptide repeat protein [Nitrospiraceae bacterium]
MKHASNSLRRDILIVLFLGAVTFAVYRQVTGFDFVNFDDPIYVTDNVRVQQGLSFDNLRWALGYAHGHWIPLDTISHMIDCHLFGMNAGGHHAVNLLFHVLNAVLLFVLLRTVTGAPWCSAFAAALFAIHPQNVEPVAWISSRKDVLSTFFGLLTLLAYAHYAKRPRVRQYVLVTLCFILALLAKPMLLTLPVLLILLDYWPLRRFDLPSLRPARVWRETRRCVLEKIPLLAIAALFAMLAFKTQEDIGAIGNTETLPLSLRASNAAVSYVLYLKRIFWPTGLSVFYPHPGARLGVLKPVAAAILLASVTGVVFAYGRRARYLFVGWFWYAIALFPVSSLLVQLSRHAMADRYAYVPTIGIFIALAWAMGHVAQRSRAATRATTVAAVVFLTALAITASVQVSYWRDSLTLWNHALAVTEDNRLAHYNLGFALREAGQLDEAARHLATVVQTEPGVSNRRFELATDGNRLAHHNLGCALREAGQLDEAARHLTRAVQIEPRSSNSRFELARVLLELGRADEAMSQLQEVLRLDPARVGAHRLLAVQLLERGQPERAIGHLAEAVKLDPEDPGARVNLAIALASLGRFDEARGEFDAVLKIDPANHGARFNLANLLLAQGNLKEAAAQFAETTRLYPDDADAHCGLAMALDGLGRKEEAAQHVDRALEIDPGHATARQLQQQRAQ